MVGGSLLRSEETSTWGNRLRWTRVDVAQQAIQREGAGPDQIRSAVICGIIFRGYWSLSQDSLYLTGDAESAESLTAKLIVPEHTVFTRRKKILTLALTAFGCLAALAVLAFVFTEEVSRVSSPDGRFYAVVTRPIWERYAFTTPGHSSDASGYITIYTADGRSCGGVSVEMISLIQDLKWSADHAEIRLVAEWDLVQHRVKRY